MAHGVAKEWEDQMADSKRTKVQRNFKERHCSSSDNIQLPAGAVAGAAVGLDTVSEEI